jgi:hypothetical protein
MRFLFASSDPALVERFKNRLDSSGIPFEVRGLVRAADSNLPSYPELWVANGDYFESAVSLFTSFQSSRN